MIQSGYVPSMFKEMVLPLMVGQLDATVLIQISSLQEPGIIILKQNFMKNGICI